MINISSIIKIAIRVLLANKMRSALTILGIIIGVGSLIAMVSIGTGANQRLTQQISSMGSNLLNIQLGSATAGGARLGAGTRPSLTTRDAEAILRECSAVEEVAPARHGRAQVISGHSNWAPLVYGTTPGMLTVREWEVVLGHPFTDQDVNNATKVALLGQTVVNNLFGDQNPVGRTIRVKNIPFLVIGVLGVKGQSPTGQDQDDVIFIPVTTALTKLFGTTAPGMLWFIMVKAKSAQDMPVAMEQIRDLLRQRHHLGLKQDDDFTIQNLAEIMQVREQSTRVMTRLLGAIASVALIVGGIGIMNIMLVSVTERTREIGIRMALGAKTWDIRLQFLVEAVTLSLIGGILGSLVGVSTSMILSHILGWPTVMSPVSILAAFGFSGCIGIFFGFYPAYKASLQNPVDALRYE